MWLFVISLGHLRLDFVCLATTDIPNISRNIFVAHAAQIHNVRAYLFAVCRFAFTEFIIDYNGTFTLNHYAVGAFHTCIRNDYAAFAQYLIPFAGKPFAGYRTIEYFVDVAL